MLRRNELPLPLLSPGLRRGTVRSILMLGLVFGARNLSADTIYRNPTVQIDPFGTVPLSAAWIPGETARKFCEIEQCAPLVGYALTRKTIPPGTRITRANLFSADDWGESFVGALVATQDRYYDSITCASASPLVYAPGTVVRPQVNGAPLTAAINPQDTARKYCEIERGVRLSEYRVSRTPIPQGTTVTRANLYSPDDWGKLYSGPLDPASDRYFESIACREVATTEVEPDWLFDLYFTRCGPGWNGGDSTYSTALSATEVGWMFSDSFVGHVDGQGNRRSELDEHGVPQVRPEDFVLGNVLVTQHRTTGEFASYLFDGEQTTSRASAPFFTLVDGHLEYNEAACTEENEATVQAVFRPDKCTREGCWFWSGDLLAENGEMKVFLNRFAHRDSADPHPFDWLWEGTSIGTLSTNALTAPPVYTPLPDFASHVVYGAALLPQVQEGPDSYTYIYGHPLTPRERSNRCVHLARARTGGLDQVANWQYWGTTDQGGIGWTNDPNRTLPLGPTASGEFSVTRMEGCGDLGAECFVLIGHELNLYSPRIVVRLGRTPVGPWSGPIPLYSTPETGQDGQLATYNSHAHPEWTNDGSLLVSYNVLAIGEGSTTVPLSHYRPHFIRVKIHG